MSWETERALPGKKPWNFIEIAVRRCQRRYGDASTGGSPSSGCFARLGVTGEDKCHNSWQTCQDRDNFLPADYWIRCGEPVENAPRSFDFSNVSPPDEGLPFFLPFLRNFAHDPNSPDPGESMGMRVRFTAQLEDGPHHDIGIDKYALERVTGEASATSAGELFFDFVDGLNRIQPAYGSDLAMVAFSRTGVATMVNSAGLIVSVPANEPRFDFDPVALAPRGLQLEEARSNILTYSIPGSEGSPSVWLLTAAAMTPNAAVSPDGTMNATLITAASGSGQIHKVPAGLAVNGIYALSCFLKAGTINRFLVRVPIVGVHADVNLGTEVVSVVDGSGSPQMGIDATLEKYGNGWYRATLVFQNLSVSEQMTIRANSAGTFYVWGAQLELCGLGIRASTSYIPTTTAAVSRGGDDGVLAIWPGFSSTIGSAVAEFVVPKGAQGSFFPNALCFSTTTADRIEIAARLDAASPRGRFVVLVGSATQADVALSGFTLRNVERVAAAWQQNNFAASLTGAPVTVDVAGNIPAVTTLRLGSLASGSNYLNGWLRKVAYYPRSLSNADLVSLSAGAPPESFFSAAGGYDPRDRGTFFRKLKARFPYYIGRALRWYQGYITDTPSLADFRRRDYIIERFDGPDSNGRIKIIASDILRLLADDRTTAPLKSAGKLTTAIASSGAVASIDVTTIDFDEYDLSTASPSEVGYVRIGSEIFTYTGTIPMGSPQTGVTLTGVTRAAPDPYTTEEASHNADDAVQRCLYLRGTVPAVIQTLMTTYGGIPTAYIPSSDWTAEAETWAPETIARLITEPEGVTKLIDEIIMQTLTWGVWFDEIDQEVKYQAIRPPDIDEEVPEITDDANLVVNSVQIKDLADEIVNEVQVLFGQIDPTKKQDEFDNYRGGLLTAQANSQSANELGQKRIKRIYARWHPSENAGVVEQFANRTLNSRSKNIVEVSFSLERKDEEIRTGGFIDMTTMYLISVLGVPLTTKLQVLQVDAKGEELSYKARESLFRAMYGRLAPEGSPDGLEGTTWLTATAAQRERYMFLADSDGFFSNGDTGKALL